MPLATDHVPQVSSADVLRRVQQAPLVPVFFHADLAHAQQIVQACYEGGIRVFEFTNRGANAFEVFSKLREFVRENCPDMLLGIGTIYNAKDAEAFIMAGADFVVQPITTADVAAICRHHDVAWVPGVLTPNEIFHATRLGAAIVKIFPGSAVGPDYVKAVHGPMPNVKIMVTGGVEPTTESLQAWFGAGVTAVGMGSQLFKNADDLGALSQRIAALMAFVETVKH
ncbi:bifunctional 4-hydroxy-2-oxoglutarate aldolase/2-dehydro-3-deoxy-phosphogluconate aldolase [Hymenobacter busanensis]|uniref:Bifunctional 4-hydroxy-2-oxoglutarate aldolase/2-dehydro-3-deoxy-phosphogluconate aldolase n=1 Tax=Hymenobacter busanensis TaxID=2607656 RepID=A0A7L4ZZZ5_9BACT|nr:bifunctional 4-hydroxy-2-oxoglutarate aldolase/2-dehydro-3-deoxy-phosphogluconate aldolase [Hymenobacter busanensis]KAA9339188.1 bifunctional 4-hydroxy-2-oxoglutarate aldolase/2-dehydro-3-deoxy-phosphogluconate aldolase [Hymenobacter busanensis]QHJ07050.1 bifunctional 4-hydroxy-2-oxoglutarate aldolase/2-dehydro-3-deoxy-phosphogluconate aldolase [Hymenobacter busanensis]